MARNPPFKALRGRGADWRPAFLATLATGAGVSRACGAAGVSRTMAYRARGAEPALAAAWSNALEDAADELALEARRRAVEGARKPKLYRGKPVCWWQLDDGTVVPSKCPGAAWRVVYEHAYSDALLIALLKAACPGVYGDRPAPPRTPQPDAALRGLSDAQLRAKMDELTARE